MLTQWVLNASNFIKATWFILFPGTIFGIFGAEEVPQDRHGPQAAGTGSS